MRAAELSSPYILPLHRLTKRLLAYTSALAPDIGTQRRIRQHVLRYQHVETTTALSSVGAAPIFREEQILPDDSIFLEKHAWHTSLIQQQPQNITGCPPFWTPSTIFYFV